MPNPQPLPFTSLLLLSLILLVRSKLVIQSPPQLKSYIQVEYPEGLHYSVANYGDVPFGKIITGSISISSHLQNCQYEDIPSPANSKIVMSLRGDCSFTTKSIVSQKQGASLAVIADNDYSEDPGRVIMVDDGKGAQLKIPTILISQEIGDLITDFITEKGKSVVISVSFETFHKEKADISLWINSNDRKSYVLIRQLQPYFKLIQQYITLSVSHPTVTCQNCPQTDCYGDNQYCINTGFIGFMNKGYGQELIREQIRQEIIFKQNQNLWWDYMTLFDGQCDLQSGSIQECSQSVVAQAGLDFAKINQKVNSSFYKKSIQQENGQKKQILSNKILQANHENRYKSGIILFPGIIINNITYRGNLDALQIFQMACNSLSNVPQSCDLTPKPKSGSIWKWIGIVIVIFIIFMTFIVIVYRRHVRRNLSKNLNNQVNELVNQYITMYESQRFESVQSAQQKV